MHAPGKPVRQGVLVRDTSEEKLERRKSHLPVLAHTLVLVQGGLMCGSGNRVQVDVVQAQSHFQETEGAQADLCVFAGLDAHGLLCDPHAEARVCWKGGVVEDKMWRSVSSALRFALPIYGKTARPNHLYLAVKRYLVIVASTNLKW